MGFPKQISLPCSSYWPHSHLFSCSFRIPGCLQLLFFLLDFLWTVFPFLGDLTTCFCTHEHSQPCTFSENSFCFSILGHTTNFSISFPFKVEVSANRILPSWRHRQQWTFVGRQAMHGVCALWTLLFGLPVRGSCFCDQSRWLGVWTLPPLHGTLFWRQTAFPFHFYFGLLWQWVGEAVGGVAG